jgi:hypothetical protein
MSHRERGGREEKKRKGREKGGYEKPSYYGAGRLELG